MASFEFYETPRTFTTYLFEAMEDHCRIMGRCFEPCVGSGAIIHPSPVALTRWTTNDLDPRWTADFGLDARQKGLWESVAREGDIDWTISNPPFTPALEIIEQAIAFSRVGVAMHLRASIHEVLKTGPRRTWMNRFPPTGLLWLPRFAYQRSRTTGKWTTDSVCACWVIWLKDPQAAQFIDYAPEWVIEDLDAETPAYRKRMDEIMARRRAA